METFDFRGLPVRYTRTGTGSPVVCLHNGGTSHVIWREVTARLASQFEFFALDLPGYGASAKPGTGYTLDNYAAMTGDFVDALGLSPVVLLGNCMGSAMSLRFAMKRPEDVRALVLVNPLTEATFSAGWLGVTYLFPKRLPRFAAPLYGQLARLRLPQWTTGQAVNFQLGPVGRAQGLGKMPELNACYASEGQLRSLLAVVDDLATYGDADRFVPGPGFPPVCTIWGTDNLVLSARAGRKLNETLRPRRAEWLKGCGHLPMLEKPEEVAAIIGEFLSAHGRAAPGAGKPARPAGASR